jgi:tRNA(Ile)-lysidine synthase
VNLSQKLENHVAKRLLYYEKALYDSRFVVAVSGGADSLALGLILHRLKIQQIWAHVNFKLRGEESAADALFVKSVADKLAIPVYINEFDTISYANAHKISIQVAARELRYQWFEHLRMEQKAQWILTAHHKDDNIETLVYNLLRSKGFEIISGIPLKRNYILRPLLSVSKKTLIHYLKHRKQDWREDTSNQKTYYLRNFIRLSILPLFLTINPNFKDQLTQKQALYNLQLKLLYHYLKKKAADICTYISENDSYQIKLSQLKSFPEYLQKLILYYIISKSLHLDMNTFQMIQQLIQLQTGSQFITQNYILVREREHIAIIPKNNIISVEPAYTITIDIDKLPIKIQLPDRQSAIEISLLNYSADSRFDDAHFLLDFAACKFPLTLRTWQPGDRMQPLGMRYHKKISDLLTDIHYPAGRKKQAAVIVSDRQIIWLQGLRQSENTRICTTTKQIIQIRLITQTAE